jgi:RNA methyltransferase, TrmH family
MLSKVQEKLIKSLHSKKGREKSGLCLVEGKKVIETAGNAIDYTFSSDDSENFADLVTTETPQDMAAVAKIPSFSKEDLESTKTLVVLDGVQDPGNVGAILRLCLGFNASLLLVDSVDVTNPKVVRSSVGAMFQVPWLTMKRDEVVDYLTSLKRPIYKLEKTDNAESLESLLSENNIFIAGSEGNGISLQIEAPSLFIPHAEELESLNVANALAIVLAK